MFTTAEHRQVIEDQYLEEGWVRLGDLPKSTRVVRTISYDSAWDKARAASSWRGYTDIVPLRHVNLPPAAVVQPVNYRAPRICVDKVWKQVQEAQKRSHSRLLDRRDVEEWAAAVKRCIAYARRYGLNPHAIYCVIHGGTIRPSSRFGGHATFIEWDSRKGPRVGRWNAKRGGDDLTAWIPDRKGAWRSNGPARHHGGRVYPLQTA